MKKILPKKIIKKPAKISSKTQESSFYKEVLMIQEEERRRISRDLHDEVGQVVVAIGATLSIIEKELKNNSIDKALEVIDENRKLIKEIAAKMKSMALTLRPPALDILGLPAVLREYFSQCTKSNPIKIQFSENSKGIKLVENIGISLYRIIQESVYNSIKYAQARKIKVDLIYSRQKLELVIEDNGKGFDVDGFFAQTDISKIGLRGIKERVSILGGKLLIKSIKDRGTKINVSIPL